MDEIKKWQMELREQIDMIEVSMASISARQDTRRRDVGALEEKIGALLRTISQEEDSQNILYRNKQELNVTLLSTIKQFGDLTLVEEEEPDGKEEEVEVPDEKEDTEDRGDEDPEDVEIKEDNEEEYKEEDLPNAEEEVIEHTEVPELEEGIENTLTEE